MIDGDERIYIPEIIKEDEFELNDIKRRLKAFEEAVEKRLFIIGKEIGYSLTDEEQKKYAESIAISVGDKFDPSKMFLVILPFHIVDIPVVDCNSQATEVIRVNYMNDSYYGFGDLWNEITPNSVENPSYNFYDFFNVFFSQIPACEENKNSKGKFLYASIINDENVDLDFDIKKHVEEFDYQYSEKYGWINRSHAFIWGESKYGSVKRLWEQLMNNKPDKTEVRDGVEGFWVKYAQLAFSIEAAKMEFWVAKGLSREEKLGIAIKIIDMVSVEYEKLQEKGASFSAFKVSDLPSNRLGLYVWSTPGLIEIKDEKEQLETAKKRIAEITKALGGLSPSQSLEVLKAHPNAFNTEINKNYTPHPVTFQSKYTPCPIEVPVEFSIKSISFSQKKFTIW